MRASFSSRVIWLSSLSTRGTPVTTGTAASWASVGMARHGASARESNRARGVLQLNFEVLGRGVRLSVNFGSGNLVWAGTQAGYAIECAAGPDGNVSTEINSGLKI